MPRQRYIQDPKTHKLIPAEEWYQRQDVDAPMVMGDIKPYKSMVDGSMIESRSSHREHLRKHQLVEIGNETEAMMKSARREPKYDREGLRRQIAEVMNSKGY
jgi:hypothetical protein